MPSPSDPRKPFARAALIEITGSHDECLYSHVAMLRAAGYAVRVVLREDVRGKQGDLGDVEAVDYVPFAAGGWRTWRDALHLRRLLAQQKVDLVVFNTAEGRRVRNFCLLPGRMPPRLGVLHNGHKLGASFTQRCIERRVRDYLVLSEFIAKQAPRRRGVRVTPFYPIYFPAVPHVPRRAAFSVVVPGRIDFRRRDYELLLTVAAAGDLPSDLHFVLLGDGSSRDGAVLRERLQRLGVAQRFTVFDHFVDQSILLGETAAADLVLPLLTPRMQEHPQYLTGKISGAYNLAYGLAVPMLLHESFGDITELARGGVFFADGQLSASLGRLYENPAILAELRQRLGSNPSFSIEAQRQHYAAAIGAAGALIP